MVQFYPRSHITVPYSVIEASIAVSQILAAPVAAGLLQLEGVWHLAGWQWLFLTEGCITVILAGVLWCRLPKSISDAKFLTAEEKQWLAAQVQGHTATCAPMQHGSSSSSSIARDSSSSKHVNGSNHSRVHRAAAAAGNDKTGPPMLHEACEGSNGGKSAGAPPKRSVTFSDPPCDDDKEDGSKQSAGGQKVPLLLHANSARPPVPPPSCATPDGSDNAEVSNATDVLAASASCMPQLSASDMIRLTVRNKWLWYLMGLKALKDVSLDALVYW